MLRFWVFNNIISLKEKYYLSFFNHQSFYWVFVTKFKYPNKTRWKTNELYIRISLVYHFAYSRSSWHQYSSAKPITTGSLTNRFKICHYWKGIYFCYWNSSHFQEWGSVQAPSPVIHKFVPYVYDDNNQATLFNDSIKYQYSF